MMIRRADGLDIADNSSQAPVKLCAASGSRHTIAAPVSMNGVGLHHGAQCTITFRPAPAGTGVVFRRSDLPDSAAVPARVEIAIQAQRRTQLGTGEGAFHTVEHVLAALAGLGIDDIYVDMDAAEPPIMDGSSADFVAALSSVGVTPCGGRREWLVLRKPVRVVDGESVYEAFPSLTSSLDVTIDFPHPLIGLQSGSYAIDSSTFQNELASARTFGFMREVDALRSAGLIQGASTANAVVLDDHGVVDGELRWPDEFVRHKALDCFGDLMLAGAPVRARIVAHKPSHRGTVAFVKALVQHAVREPAVYTAEDILQILPHRYPILLVDRILEIEEGKRIVGLKNVTLNEPFFQGHFPGHPVMPGVLIVEAMAQVGGVLLMRTVNDPVSKVVYFMSLDNVKFRRPVRPGDQLRFELDVLQMRGTMCKMRGKAFVDDQVVCEAEMAAMVRDR